MRDAKAKTRARGIRKESDVGSTRTRRVPVERLSRHESGNRAESVVGRSRTGEASVERTKRTGMAVRGDADADAVDGTGEAGGEVSATDAAPWQSVQLWGGMRHDSVSARKNAVGARAGPARVGQCLTQHNTTHPTRAGLTISSSRSFALFEEPSDLRNAENILDGALFEAEADELEGSLLDGRRGYIAVHSDVQVRAPRGVGAPGWQTEKGAVSQDIIKPVKIREKRGWEPNTCCRVLLAKFRTDKCASRTRVEKEGCGGINNTV